MSILLAMAQRADTIAILGHIRPDGDCIGSCLAVLNYLREQYPDKKVQVYLEKPDLKFDYLSYFDTISQELDNQLSYDLCICLDCSDAARMGDFVCYLEGAGESLCLDHHITNRGYAQENIIKPDASSTCEVLYDYLDSSKISRAVAECLYTGIIHDTNVFKNSNTTARTMEIAGRMMEKGVNFGTIIDNSFYRKTYVQNQLLGRALLESFCLFEGACIFSVIRKQDLGFYGAVSFDLEGIVDQLRITEGVECAVFLQELQTCVYKVSMRSNHQVDVSKVAAFFGGGGHIRAAGCTITGNMHDVVNNLSSQIKRQMIQKPAKEQE